MKKLVARRLLAIVPVMFIVSLIAFSIIHIVPGDAAAALAGEGATREQVELTREALGLNDPILVQYGRWIGNALTGDLGRSLFTPQDVTTAILGRLPVTMSLILVAMAFALLVGVPAGILAAVNRGRWVDRVVNLGAATGVAAPNYFIGLLLIIALSLNRGWFPALGYAGFAEDPVEWLRHLALPALALGSATAAVITRQLRSALIGVMAQDYVRTAYAKGLRRHSVLLKHSLKNATIPVITALGSQFALLVGGTAIVELIFGIPGMGALAIEAVVRRDMPIVQGIVLLSALIVQLVNLLTDVSYSWLNPKVRVG